MTATILDLPRKCLISCRKRAFSYRFAGNIVNFSYLCRNFVFVCGNIQDFSLLGRNPSKCWRNTRFYLGITGVITRFYQDYLHFLQFCGDFLQYTQIFSLYEKFFYSTENFSFCLRKYGIYYQRLLGILLICPVIPVILGICQERLSLRKKLQKCAQIFRNCWQTCRIAR